MTSGRNDVIYSSTAPAQVTKRPPRNGVALIAERCRCGQRRRKPFRVPVRSHGDCPIASNPIQYGEVGFALQNPGVSGTARKHRYVGVCREKSWRAHSCRIIMGHLESRRGFAHIGREVVITDRGGGRYGVAGSTACWPFPVARSLLSTRLKASDLVPLIWMQTLEKL